MATWHEYNGEVINLDVFKRIFVDHAKRDTSKFGVYGEMQSQHSMIASPYIDLSDLVDSHAEAMAELRRITGA